MDITRVYRREQRRRRRQAAWLRGVGALIVAAVGLAVMTQLDPVMGAVVLMLAAASLHGAERR